MMNRAVRMLLLSVAWGGPWACNEPFEVERDPNAPIQTDRLTYLLQPVEGLGEDVHISYAFTNRTAGSVFIANCQEITGVTLERLVGEEWEDAWSNDVPACVSPPIEVLTGGTVEKELEAFFGDVGCGCDPQLESDRRTGVFRLVLTNVEDSFEEGQPVSGDVIPKTERVSHPFRIERP